MMCVDAAPTAEVVCGNHRIEAVDGKEFLSLDDLQAINRYGGVDCSPSTAKRVVATSRVLHSVRQFQFKHDAAAVASEPMAWLDRRIANEGEAGHGAAKTARQ